MLILPLQCKGKLNWRRGGVLRAAPFIVFMAIRTSAMSADLELACLGTYSEARPNALEVPVSFVISITIASKDVVISSDDVPNLGSMGLAHAILTRADPTTFVFETKERSRA